MTISEQLSKRYQGPLAICFRGAFNKTVGVFSQNREEELLWYIFVAFQKATQQKLPDSEMEMFAKRIEEVTQWEESAPVFWVKISDKGVTPLARTCNNFSSSAPD